MQQERHHGYIRFALGTRTIILLLVQSLHGWLPSENFCLWLDEGIVMR